MHLISILPLILAFTGTLKANPVFHLDITVDEHSLTPAPSPNHEYASISSFFKLAVVPADPYLVNDDETLYARSYFTGGPTLIKLDHDGGIFKLQDGLLEYMFSEPGSFIVESPREGSGQSIPLTIAPFPPGTDRSFLPGIARFATFKHPKHGLVLVPSDLKVFREDVFSVSRILPWEIIFKDDGGSSAGKHVLLKVIESGQELTTSTDESSLKTEMRVK